MFIFNDRCDEVLLDWDHIESPEEILALLKNSGSLRVLVVSSKDKAEFYESLPKELIFSQLGYFEEISWLGISLFDHLSMHSGLSSQVFITGSIRRVSEINELPIGTILLHENPTHEAVRTGADLVIKRANMALLISRKFYAGMAGEIDFFPKRQYLPGYDKGVVPMRFIPKINCDQGNFSEAFPLGRWLNKDDPYKSDHHFTSMISFLKDHPSLFSSQVSNIVEGVIKHIARDKNILDFRTTFVPQKPTDKFDRNEILLGPLLRQGKVVKLLKCVSTYPSQKSAGGPRMRAQNVLGKYAATGSIPNVPVFLFDDVLTTGSTLNEVSGHLLNAGASRVLPITLGLTCARPNHHSVVKIPCVCGKGSLRIRFKGDDGNPFWGCEQWRPETKNDHNNLSFAQGLVLIRQLRAKAK